MRRHDVVEEAVVLVVGDQQCGPAPHLGVAGQRVEDLGDVPGAEADRPVRVLGERLGRRDPRDLRELAGLHVRPQHVEVAARRRDVRAGAGPLVQGRAGRRVLVVVEVQQRVVAVVADVGVAGPAPGVRLVEPLADVLVDLPGDPGLLEALGVGAPVVAGLVVVEHRAAALAVVPGPAGPLVVAVRVGVADERAVVGVADGERVGQGEVERRVAATQVRHGRGGLVGDPAVVGAPVDRVLGVRPAVREVLEEDQAEVLHVGPEGHHLAVAVGLVPHGAAGRQRGRVRVTEAADPAHGAEVVVEGAVLLHQDDDVLDVLQRAGPAVGGQRRRTGDAVGEQRGGGGATADLEEATTVEGRHREAPGSEQ